MAMFGFWVEKTYKTKRGQEQVYRGQVSNFVKA